VTDALLTGEDLVGQLPVTAEVAEALVRVALAHKQPLAPCRHPCWISVVLYHSVSQDVETASLEGGWGGWWWVVVGDGG
jgi:hypothetical protein